jgi:catechol 2,3-dioxygenase-like lactoylglutathione lyase family enzyme
MSHKGFSHIGLSTRDLDSTREFYEHVMGFKVARCDIIKVAEGGQIRHIFFDTGRDQLIAFMEPQGVPGIPADYDAGINAGLGVPGSFYHFAFEAGSVAALEAKRQELLAKGVAVTDIVDHEWAQSIYFLDPNGISLEYCCLTRDVGTEDDVTMQVRVERSVQAMRQRWDRLREAGACLLGREDITDRVGETVSDAERALMRQHFRRTSTYEWMFWDAGYRRETWPV